MLSYAGALYVASSLVLPKGGGTITLKKSTANINSVTYPQHALAYRTGASLHKTLGNVFRPAPATPGEIAINPITKRPASPNASSVSTEVTAAGGGAGDDDETIYLAENDTITIRVLDQRSLGTITATLIIGSDVAQNHRTLTPTTSKSTDAQKIYTYTVQASDPSGGITYKIEGANDRGGKPTTLTGEVRHENKRAVIDKAAPTASIVFDPSGAAVRKTAVVTVVEDNPTDTISYKIHTAACSDKSAYDAVTGGGETVALEKTDAGLQARILLFGANLNTKYICVKVVDKKGQEGYAASAAISGMEEASLVISEWMYASVNGVSHEWIEVTNVGSSGVSLTKYDLMGWRYTKDHLTCLGRNDHCSK